MNNYKFNNTNHEFDDEYGYNYESEEIEFYCFVEDTEESYAGDFLKTYKPKTIYMRWADKNCNGTNPEWIIMTGEEYYAFKTSPEAKGRFFTYDFRLPKIERIYKEVTHEDYKKWDAERKVYVRMEKYKEKHQIVEVSMDERIDDGEGEELTYHDVVADPSSDFEDKLVLKMTIDDAVAKLKPKDKEVIDLLFTNNHENKSVVKIAKEIGIPRKTLNNRKLAAFKSLKKILLEG